MAVWLSCGEAEVSTQLMEMPESEVSMCSL